MMKSTTKERPRSQKSKSYHSEGPNWVLIAGGALLSTLSIHLGYKLKQVLDTKQEENAENGLKGKNKSLDKRKAGGYRMNSNVYSFMQDEDACFNFNQGHEGMKQQQQHSNGQTMFTESDVALPLVTIPAPQDFSKDNSTESPCVSESGSDMLSKREVVQKLRSQVRRRDEMIVEMQDQIIELQNSLNAHISRSSHLQSLVDAANQEALDSEREIQRLRKAIADHCSRSVRGGVNGGYVNGEMESGRVEMLKREVGELKEVIEGKEYLLKSFKEQKEEMGKKMRELQQRLDSQLPNIL